MKKYIFSLIILLLPILPVISYSITIIITCLAAIPILTIMTYLIINKLTIEQEK